MVYRSPSSNYGRETAAAKELPKAPKMTFQPNLDLSATAKKMRSKAPSGTYLQERPVTFCPALMSVCARADFYPKFAGPHMLLSDIIR